MTERIKVGDKLPGGSFRYIPWIPDLEAINACGVAIKLDIKEEWKGKKVVLFAVPGAFTPSCHVNHIPGYIKHSADIKAKGVDVVACVASNDAFVMSGWGRYLQIKDDIIMLSDYEAAWSSSIGLAQKGNKTLRYALFIDNLTVKYIGVEDVPGKIAHSGAEHILAFLENPKL